MGSHIQCAAQGVVGTSVATQGDGTEAEEMGSDEDVSEGCTSAHPLLVPGYECIPFRLHDECEKSRRMRGVLARASELIRRRERLAFPLSASSGNVP